MSWLPGDVPPANHAGDVQPTGVGGWSQLEHGMHKVLGDGKMSLGISPWQSGIPLAARLQEMVEMNP